MWQRARHAVFIAFICALGIAGCTGQGSDASPSGRTTQTGATGSLQSSGSSTSTGDATPRTVTVTTTTRPTMTVTQKATTPATSPTSTQPQWVTTERRMQPRTSAGTVAEGWSTTTEPEHTEYCAMGPPSASPFAKGSGVFTCGPIAASLIACWNFDGGKVGCMQNDQQKLVMFTSPVTYTGAPQSEPSPMRVTLADGRTCTPVAHDHGRHYQDRNGWLECGTDTVLLHGDDLKYGYFHTGQAQWTADAVPSEGLDPPTPVKVREIWFVQGD